MLSWLSINRSLFSIRAAIQNRGAAQHAAQALSQLNSCSANERPARAQSPERMLHAAWGRIGDAVLGTGTLRHFRQIFPDVEIVHLGRPETEAIVAPHVDRFISWDDADSLPARLHAAGPWRWIIGDLHMAYGGTRRWGPLLAALPAERRILSAGYSHSRGLLPHPDALPGFETVPLRRLAAPGPEELADRHVSRDDAHYLAALIEQLVPGTPVPDDLRPVLDLPPPDPAGGQQPAIILQPFSNNPKKDPQPALWRALCEAYPQRRFIALGTDRAAVDRIGAANLDNRAGQTSMETALALIAGGAAFVGPDSGLTHAAVALGVDTVCVSQSANLGYFFPYPPELDSGQLHTVHDPASLDCSGCFMTCQHEAIWTTARKGARCLRAVQPTMVIDAVAAALHAAAARPSAEASNTDGPGAKSAAAAAAASPRCVR